MPDDFLGAVAGHPGVGGIDVLNGSRAIGDHHGIRRLVDGAHQAGPLQFRADIPGGLRVGLRGQIRLLAHGSVGGHGQGQSQESDGGDGGLLKRLVGYDWIRKLISKPSHATQQGCFDQPAGNAAAGKIQDCVGIPKLHRGFGRIRIQEHGGYSMIAVPGNRRPRVRPQTPEC